MLMFNYHKITIFMLMDCGAPAKVSVRVSSMAQTHFTTSLIHPGKTSLTQSSVPIQEHIYLLNLKKTKSKQGQGNQCRTPGVKF